MDKVVRRGRKKPIDRRGWNPMQEVRDEVRDTKKIQDLTMKH